MELGLALAQVPWLHDIRAKTGDRTGEGGRGRAWGRTGSDKYQPEDVRIVRQDWSVESSERRQWVVGTKVKVEAEMRSGAIASL